MITNIRLELSDLERNDLAKRIDRDPDTKRLVTRKEVTELVLALVDDEVTKGWESTNDERDSENVHEHTSNNDVRSSDSTERRGVSDEASFVPSRGDEPYLAQPRDPGIAAACTQILDASALIEKFAWDTIERNRKK